MGNTRYLLFCAAIAAAPAARADDGVANIFRSVTNALTSQSAPQKPEPPPTAVLGIRGIDSVDAAQNGGGAKSDKDLQLIDSWASNQADAEKAAKTRKLAARDVTLGNAAAGARP